ncbi:hypothetical protein NEHOM01_2411 [Nematocida homosporus]|uniref:uncharacterized protein n=1 Tax=Nematocida homosporus TaxID=1912981 RepID=UPI00222057CA|nr:uncharacterized protein NEHOM01_2411 [Nematocida homosporus]KAI5187854.1 hypothetical protein NEHOM01_2411 [Nematocida homosporus]
MGMCVLLILLNRVSGAPGVSIGLQPTWKTSGRMIKTLKSLGFMFNQHNSTVQVARYTSRGSSTGIPTLDLSYPILLCTPRWQVKCDFERLSFILPNYADATTAKTALTDLRTIAVVKVKYACVFYQTPNINCQKESMKILSRVINMIDCCYLELRFNDSLLKEVDPAVSYLTECRSEARNTVLHANYESKCQLNVAIQLVSTLTRLIDSEVVLQRPLASVYLMGDEFKSIHLLNQLPLVDNYAIYLSQLPAVANIDFGFLQSSSSKCGRISLINNQGVKLTLTGLDNAMNKHPEIALNVSWETLLDLIENDNPVIRVHTISVVCVEPDSIELMAQPLPSQPIADSWLVATTIALELATTIPCRPLKDYKKIYTPAALAKYGIAITTTEISYKEDRNDLQNTLNVFDNINAWSIGVSIDAQANDIICCGEGLNIPEWMPQEKLHIQLSHNRLSHMLTGYQNAGYVSFCQNIRYTDILIVGYTAPRIGSTDKCIDLLDLFQNITAQSLTIQNVRDKKQKTTEFDPNSLQAELATKPKYLLNVETLTLNSVDVKIIYWMLGHYDLTCLRKVYIKNQNFTNLAIAQFLSHPAAFHIKCLVLDDFLGLSEIQNYKKQEPLNSFSLFTYVEQALQNGKTLKDLALNKLLLQPANVDYTLHSEVLSVLWGYGIQFVSLPFSSYIKGAPARSSLANTMTMEKLTLYNATLDVLASDFTRFQSIAQSKLYSAQRTSVENLHICFSNTSILAVDVLVTIIRWVAYQFKDLVSLRLKGVKISKAGQRLMTSRDYIIAGLESLNSIQLDGENPRSRPIELLTRPYRISPVVLVSQPKPAFIVMKSHIASQLIDHLDNLDKLFPASDIPNTVPQIILRNLKDTNPTITCSICYRQLNLLREEKNTNPDSKNSNPTVKPNDYFTTICYTKCGHSFCNDCIVDAQKCVGKKCSYCRSAYVTDDIQRLISLPQSSFIVTKGSLHLSATEHQQIHNLAGFNGQVYVYVADRYPTNLADDLAIKVTSSTFRNIYII